MERRARIGVLALQGAFREHAQVLRRLGADVVEVRWPYIDVSGDEIGAESSTYIVRREDDGEIMIRATIMQGEATRH